MSKHAPNPSYNPPFNAYDGDKPYIFASYSHQDAKLVYKELTNLHEAGYNIWYDEGIRPSKDFIREIAEAIDGCSLFVVFISRESAFSQYVDKEIKYAFEKNKRILAIHLEEVDLPSHLKFLLGTTQAIMKYMMSNEIYTDKLKKTLFDTIKATLPTTGGNPRPTGTRRPALKLNSLLGYSGIILAVVLVILYYLGVFKPSGSDTPASNTPAANPGSTIEMSAAAASGISNDVPAVNASTYDTSPVSGAKGSMVFSPAGVATVSLNDGRELTAAANCLVFKAYESLMTGFPMNSLDRSVEGMISFDDMQSFEVAKGEEYGKYTVSISLSDGTKAVKSYSIGSIVGSSGGKGFDLELKDIKSVAFRHKDPYTAGISTATVEASSGSSSTVPADTIKLMLLTMGMGPSPSWLNGLPTAEGNLIEFKKLKVIEVLEGKSTGFNGWDQEIKAKLTFTDGTEMTTTIKGDSLILYGLNKLGIFNLGLADELKKVSFNWN